MIARGFTRIAGWGSTTEDRGASTVEAEFESLKRTLVRLTTLVLLILFVERAVGGEDAQSLLMMGTSFALVIAAVNWAVRGSR